MNRVVCPLLALMTAVAALTACEVDAPKKKDKKAPATECAPLEPEVLLVVEASDRMRSPLAGQKHGDRWEWLVHELKQALPHAKKHADLGLLVFPGGGADEAPSGPATVSAEGKGDSAWAPEDDDHEDDDHEDDDDEGDDDDHEGKGKGKSKKSCSAGPAPSPAPPEQGVSTVDAGFYGMQEDRCRVGAPQVPIGSPYGKIVSTLEHVEPAGSAPVAQALRRAGEYFAARDPNGRSRHVVLIAGGDEGCRGDVVAEIQALRELGVDVWVASFADVSGAASADLDAWAVAGGHSQGGARAWSALQSGTDLEELTKAVLATAPLEACDGLDNDCDGEVDEDLARPCLTGCGGGEQVCVAGTWRACGQTGDGPPEELCDGVDNDCDGETDEGFGVGEACTEEAGPCLFQGVTACTPDGASVSCDTGDQWPTTEVCDGVDNDCDGAVDEGADEDCSTECQPGTRACVDGALGACQLGEPYEERCDGVDNDCDGEVDEGWSVGTTCIAQSGACLGMGVIACAKNGESATCVATETIAASDEVCNGVDDDCNGVIDDGVAVASCAGGQKCYAGQCIWD